MSWNNAAVTNAGVALLNESLAGHILTITSAVGGAGTLEDQELASAVDVVDQKQTFCLMGLEDLEQGKQVGVQISNKGVSESYILHQIGVKARLEYEEEETLLFLLQDDRGVEIPAEAENPDFLFEVYATIAISNKANITINVNPHVVASVEYVDRTFVKLTRKINGKDLSQDVTLTGEDISVSEEDDTSISAALPQKADKGPPQEYDLPLMEGWEKYGTCRYSKDQMGIVRIYASVKYTGDTASQNVRSVSIMPAGYRPMEYIAYNVLVNYNGSQTIGAATINTDGSVLLHYYDTLNNSSIISWVMEFIAQ